MPKPKKGYYVVTMMVEMFQEVRVRANSEEEARELAEEGKGRWMAPDGAGDPEYMYTSQVGPDWKT